MATGVFRWKAIVPLLLFTVAAAAAWALFADRLARRAVESLGTTLIGAKVEIQALHIDLGRGDVSVRGLTVASPHDSLKNLLQADELVADLDALPLLEKKVVIDRLVAKGLRFGTPRESDGRVVGRADAVTGRVMSELDQWAKQLQVPALQIATGKIDVGTLDPSRLSTPREAEALAARADSSRKAWQTALAGLDVQVTVDSATQTLQRLRTARVTDLAALNAARKTIDEVKRARDRVVALERDVKTGLTSLQAGVAGLETARQRDYAVARGLVKLPSLDAPEIGAALFAPAAISRFQHALYWAELARRYMPPGLLPRAAPGPKRLRRAGTTVRFPRERALPGFLLRAADVSFMLDPTAPRPKVYEGRLKGLTSDPALYGRPTTLDAAAPAVRVAALLDHTRDTPRDTAAGEVRGVQVPAFTLPSLPVRLDPGRGTVALSLGLRGDTVRARWTVHSESVRWARDTVGGGGARSQAGDLVWRVVSGISSLEVSAGLAGTLSSPRLVVSSNLDQAVAARIRAVAGEEVAAAERRLRAEVDRAVDQKAAPAKAQVAALTSDVTAKISEQRARLEQAQRALEQRLRELTRGIRLP